MHTEHYIPRYITISLLFSMSSDAVLE